MREDEQRRSAAVVGVNDVDFLGFTDSEIVNSPELRAAITREVQQRHPDVVAGRLGEDDALVALVVVADDEHHGVVEGGVAQHRHRQ